MDGNAWVYGDAQVYGNAQVYGDAWVYGDARVYCDARVSGNAQVYGDAHEKSPLQIQGTKHFFNISANGKVKVGCVEFELSNWEARYKQIGEDNGYTEQEIKEYSLYFKLAVELQKLNNK